jgi:L,D-transpeptidase YcbB
MNGRLKKITLILLMLGISQSGYPQEFPNGIGLESALGDAIAYRKLHQPKLVQDFYKGKDYQLVWTSQIDIAIFLGALQCAADEGLNPDDYHLKPLQQYHQKTRNNQDQLFFELLLTDAFIHYASDMVYGKVNPVKVYPGEWGIYNKKVNLIELLDCAIQEKSITATIESLRPVYKGYNQLQHALLKFKSLNAKGGFAIVPQDSTIKPGMNDPRIALIRERLKIIENLTFEPVNDTCAYDSVLVDVVKQFQHHSGLIADGIIGKKTLAALNTPIEKYIQKITINMERYRWLPHQLGEAYISVNIPDFHADVMVADTLVMRMKTIVGRPERKTPVLSSELRYLIINPTWTVPPTILKEDALPAIRRNINYLKRNNLKVVNRGGEEIDPYTLPWYKYNERNFPYQLVQEPGPSNSLGLIKFQFPNNHRVFLHDTNAHGLFAATNRALSSGCIRIEHPFVLANYLLSTTSWTNEKLNKVIASGKTQTITIPGQVSIHIFYFTAFVNEQNQIQFRNDMYGWDELLYKYFFTESNLY